MKRGTRVWLLAVLIPVAIIISSSLHASVRNFPLDESRVLSLVADTVVGECQKEVARIREEAKQEGQEFYDEVMRERGFVVHDALKVTYNDTVCYAVLAGCGGLADVMLLDSASASLQRHAVINTATHYLGFQGAKDITNDSIPELWISVASGSHGGYGIFISMYPDSLRFVTDEKGNYTFNASGGSVDPKDIDNDGIYELVLDEMVWPGEKNPPQGRYTVMRLKNGVFVTDTTIDVR